jgi:NDP-sugar pyrophosphorylase family protein
MMEALVLAAGKGSRLGALTARCPKPLLPIGGRPALFSILDWLKAGHVTRVTLNLHHCPEAFYQTLGANYAGMDIAYREEPRLLGSAGTLRAYLADGPDRPALLVYGDVLTTLPIARLVSFHTARAMHPSATLVIHAVPDPQSGGVVMVTGDKIVAFQEKPAQPTSSLIYGGVAVVDPGILAYLPETIPCDLGGEVFPALCERDFPLYAYRLAEGDYLIDFGTPRRYQQACREWPERARDDSVANAAAG